MRRITIVFLTLLVSITGVAVIPANADTVSFGCYTVTNGILGTVWGEPECQGAIIIDSSVREIGYATHISESWDEGITSITIPKETNLISYFPFIWSTDSLLEFIVAPDNANFSSVEGVLYNKNQTRLISYPRGKLGTSFTVPETVIQIDQYAFCATYLETINIGENTVDVAPTAFDYNGSCYSSALREIVVDSENPNYTTEYGVLFDKLKTTLIKYPAAKTDISYVVPNTVTRISKISYNSNLASITLPNSLNTIDQYAFHSSALTSLHIPASVTSYGPFPTFASAQLQSFSVAEASTILKAIDGVLYSKDGTRLIEYPGAKTQTIFTIPSGVTSLESQWLVSYTNLQKIRIPASVTYMSYLSFPVLIFEGDSNLLSADGIFANQISYCGRSTLPLFVAFTSAANSNPYLTFGCGLPPDAPIIGVATALSPTSATISFTAPAFDGGKPIVTYTATSDSDPISGTLLQAGSGSIIITGLTASTAYTFTVTATNSVGTSPASSATVSITTPASEEENCDTIGNNNIGNIGIGNNNILDEQSCRDSNNIPDLNTSIITPGAPVIGTATALSPTSASISFTAPTNNGGATIETYTATSNPNSMTGTFLQAGSGSITITGLTASTAYTFTVTATNSAGTSSPSSATVSITMPASAEELAAQAAARVAAVAAAVKAAEEKRETEKKAARSEISRKAIVAEKLTFETFSKAEIPGITAKNIDAVQAEILALPVESRADISKVLMIARKFEVVEIIASDRIISISSAPLVEIGLIPADSKYKSSLVAALRNLPVTQRSNLSSIKVAIDTKLKEIQERLDRTAAIRARIPTRLA